IVLPPKHGDLEQNVKSSDESNEARKGSSPHQSTTCQPRPSRDARKQNDNKPLVVRVIGLRGAHSNLLGCKTQKEKRADDKWQENTRPYQRPNRRKDIWKKE